MGVSRRDWLKWSAGSALAMAAGCENQPDAEPVGTAVRDDKPLRVLLVAPPEKYAEKLQRLWLSQSDAPFELLSSSVEEALAAKRFKADVIVYPTHLLGAFAATERIAPLSRTLTDGEMLHAGDLLRHARTTEVTWGAATMAICLGMPTFALFYRQDFLDEQGLEPPTTWAEYQSLVERLAKLDEPLAVAEPLADAADSVLLARAASYVRNRTDYGGIFDLKTMGPLVAAAPYVRALEELVAVQKAMAEKPQLLSREAAMRQLLAGESALAWGWPTAVGNSVDAPHAGKISIAPLPGSADVYDFRGSKWLMRGAEEETRVPFLGAAGVLGSVTTEARRPKVAESFLAWLSAGENAVEVAASRADASPFRRSHLTQPRAWLPSWLSSAAAEQFTSIIRDAQEQSVVLLALRLPGATEYAAALRQAVKDAVAGQGAREALTAAATAFDAITDRLGRDTQRQAYQRSLGMDV